MDNNFELTVSVYEMIRNWHWFFEFGFNWLAKKKAFNMKQRKKREERRGRRILETEDEPKQEKNAEDDELNET